MSKTQYPRELCDQVLAEMLPILTPQCATVFIGDDAEELGLKVCGSYRRGQKTCGDLDIVYVTKRGPACPPGLLFPESNQPLADLAIAQLIDQKILALRPKGNGTFTNGQWIKLLVHVATGLPIDFYAAKDNSYSNLVLCRTGSATHNIRLASAAQAKGWKWTPTAKFPGFQDGYTEIPIDNDRHAFALLGLPYLEPQDR